MTEKATQALHGQRDVSFAEQDLSGFAKGHLKTSRVKVPPPPRQRPYDQALQMGFDALLMRSPEPEKLDALGVALNGCVIRVTVLGRCLNVDLDQREVLVEGKGRARSVWAVLVVHYLCADNLEPDARQVSFSYFQDCSSYLSVFGKRITGRFLATAGRTEAQFTRVAQQHGGRRAPGAGVGYCFDILPRVPITILRFEGDEEVCSGASILYHADAERLLPAEDRVVAAELLLDTFSGKSMAEDGGAA